MSGEQTSLRQDCMRVIGASIAAVLPDAVVKRALRKFPRGKGKLVLISVGKAAWRMAHAAMDVLGTVDGGVVITKYGHLLGPLPPLICYEAGHPIPDEKGVAATEAAIAAVRGLTAEDTVLVLLSGGGSAVFERPLIPLRELRRLTEDLLASGADIHEINAVRKRLSAVKGGKFAALCAPARVVTVALSDVLSGDPSDIASGPTCADRTTAEEAQAIANRYHLPAALLPYFTGEAEKLENASEVVVGGSVKELVRAAASACRSLGYKTEILSDHLSCEARVAGRHLGNFLRAHAGEHGHAYVLGGECVVHVTGRGRGGRNQELALAAADVIAGLSNVALFSIGSDGTDGPTDAAGGYVDGQTRATLARAGLKIDALLRENDSYRGLNAADGLLFTGPTGTNVNDLTVALIR